MLRHFGWSVVGVLLAGLTAPVQGQVKLEWKFKEGDKFYLENVTTLKQSIVVMDRKIPVDTVNTTVSSFKVLKADKSSVVVEQTIESVKAKGQQLGPQQMVAEQLQGTKFTITMNTKGEVTKFEGFDGLLKKLSQDNEEIAKLLKNILTEDLFKQGLQESFAFMPDKAVSKGDNWKRKMSVPMGPMGTFAVDMDYTYEGKGKEGEQIAVKGVYGYQPPKGGGGGDLPFKVTAGDFKTEEAKGTMVFDTAAGRLVRYEFKAKLKGSMTISIADQNATMELQQETDAKIRVMDKWQKDL